jgi:hypothetical protein
MTKISVFECWNFEFVIYLLFDACYLEFKYSLDLKQ